MKYLVAATLLALACLAASPDIAVYPGATVDEQVGNALRKDHPGGVGYNSVDAFEKVDDYYKKLGGQDVPHSRIASSYLKYVVVSFPGKTSLIQLSWAPADKKHGTVIQIFPKKP
jgi:hypothetical protein